MGVREEKKEAQRRAILETTIAMVRERGLEETRVQEVIGQLGISEKTFFNYFPSKVAVLEAHALQTNQLYTALLRAELAQPSRPVVERLKEIVRVQASFFTADRDLIAVMATCSGIFVGATGALRQLQQANQHLLGELLAEGQARGELDPAFDPLQLAELFTATFLLTTLNWLTGWWEHAGDLEPRLLVALNVFLRGCVPGRSKMQTRA